MAWEDRTPAKKRQAYIEAAKYARTDDDKTYVVAKGGALFTVKGRNSARVVAGKDGTITEKKGK
jgi:hypothetical protein